MWNFELNHLLSSAMPCRTSTTQPKFVNVLYCRMAHFMVSQASSMITDFCEEIKCQSMIFLKLIDATIDFHTFTINNKKKVTFLFAWNTEYKKT